MSTDLMIDIETLGTNNNAHVMSIGMVWFDRHHPDEPLIELPIIHPELNQTLSKIDAKTVQFWMQQNSEAKQIFADTVERTHLYVAATQVMEQVKQASRIWAKDPDFDCVILANFVSHYGDNNFEWPFFNNRSVRTMLDNYPVAKNIPFEGVKHNALADAVHQAKQMQMCYTLLKHGSN